MGTLLAASSAVSPPCGQGALKGEGVLWTEDVLEWKNDSLVMRIVARCRRRKAGLRCIRTEIEGR